MIYKNILKSVNWILYRNPKKINAYLCPMKRVRIRNTNENFTAIDNFEIVSKLRNLSFNKGSDINDFMKQYARRAVISANEDIRATSVDDFVTDLIKLKHIILEDDKVSLN